ncbi:MAG: hypothetical protein J3R72DRAFT_488650 [Linnemannia gamsii]|nr:MAG: hypothetical protein J3R72DRAFT_488650 [Linnemannia gamsii]
MSASRQTLPAEILALIFRYLEQEDLYECLLVSHLWHAEAEARLYSDVILDALLDDNTLLVQAVKNRKHLLRRVEWRAFDVGVILALDLLDILLDYHHPVDDDGDVNTSHLFSFIEQEQEDYYCATTPTTRLSHPLGPNRPALTHFSYRGSDSSWRLFDSILYELTTLVSLDLDFAREDWATEAYTIDMDKILDAFPHLRNLTIVGWMHKYGSTWTTQLEDFSRLSLQTSDNDATNGSGGVQPHRLESFTFNSLLTWRNGPDAFTFFSRLANLRKIVIRSKASSIEAAQRSRPWAFGRALKQFCPNLESIDSSGQVALWLFDLPILPSNRISHITALVPDPSPSDVLGKPARQARPATKRSLAMRLRDQEWEELLEGKGGIEPFFPQLKALILGWDHTLSAQDLISLGVQARFLTYLEINYQPANPSYVWGMHDKDAAAYADEDVMFKPILISMGSDQSIEDRRLRKRRKIEDQDVMLFLQHCSSLRHFALTKYNIPFKNLLVERDDNDNAGTTPKTTATASVDVEADDEEPSIRPWACEDTLEYLHIGFELSDNEPEQHRLVWKHLGRFKKLTCLVFARAPLYWDRLALIPSVSHGVEGLLNGGRGEGGGGGGGVARTLQEIRHLPTWWKVEDRGAMVEWFARSCPRLTMLGLEHKREYVEGVKRNPYMTFLEEERVKQCSILGVFIESIRS